MSKFCLIVDASCDIPASFHTTECLRILPTRISVAGAELMDTRDPVQTLAFYSKYLHDSDATSGKSDALSEDQMIGILNRAIATHFDEALGVFVSSERSPIYQRAKRAAQKGEKSVSALAGFAAKTLFITPILRGHRNKTEPVGRKFGVGKARDAMLDRVTQLIEHKSLLSPHVALSFSGQLEEVHAMPGYARLLSSAAKAKVQVHLSHMSITAAINVGPQSLSVGVIAKEHTFA